MRHTTIILLLLALCAPRLAAQKSDEAQYLLRYLRSIYGKQILSGTCATVNWNTNEAQWVHHHTGQWPAINTFDFIHDIHSSKGGWIDYDNASIPLEWAQQGGIVSCMWHWNMPTNDGRDYTCTPGSEAGQTSFSPASCIDDPSSAGYKELVARIDRVSQWLKPLRDAGVAVLWRPLHEAQGNWTEANPGNGWHKAWFWWGIDGPEAYVKLWHLMYDRMVNHHELNNLIWVFNFGDSYRWYPGDAYVDIVGTDVYNVTNAASLGKTMKDYAPIYPDKMMALCEVGNIPAISKIWAQGGKYLYFNAWYDYSRTNKVQGEAFESTDHDHMNIDAWREAWAQDYVLKRDDLPCLFKTVERTATIWEGSHALNWNWDGMLRITKADVAKLAVGTQLRFTLAEDNNGWIQFQAYPSKSQIQSNDFPESGGLHPGKTAGVLTITADLLNKLKNGFYIHGGGCTLSRIELVTQEENPDFTTDPAGIGSIQTTPTATVRYYNLNGQPLAPGADVPAGIYIANGRKVLNR